MFYKQQRSLLWRNKVSMRKLFTLVGESFSKASSTSTKTELLWALSSLVGFSWLFSKSLDELGPRKRHEQSTLAELFDHTKHLRMTVKGATNCWLLVAFYKIISCSYAHIVRSGSWLKILPKWQLWWFMERFLHEQKLIPHWPTRAKRHIRKLNSQ